ncbi:MAG: nitroreductase family protein [Coriobacteriia bacterium]|nr:nitroreductase family protein [Coriobacteriia bacterium]
MELIEAIHGRRSIRMFDGQPLDHALIAEILDAATYAPSRMNTQPWHFHVATGDARRRAAEVMAMTTAYLEEYIDVLGPDAVEHAARFYADLGAAPIIIGVASLAEEDCNVARDYAISVGAAIQNVLLVAHDRGVAGCSISSPHWVRDRLSSVFGVRDGWEIMSLIVLGYGIEQPHEHQRDTDVVTYLT